MAAFMNRIKKHTKRFTKRPNTKRPNNNYKQELNALKNQLKKHNSEISMLKNRLKSQTPLPPPPPLLSRSLNKSTPP